EDLAVPGDDLGGRADDQRLVDAVHGVGVARLADADDPAVADADIGLDHAPVVEDDRPGDHQVGGALRARARRLAHRLADHLPAAEQHLVAGRGSAAAVLGDLDQQVGVGQPDAVADRGAEQVDVAGALDGRHRGPLSSSAPEYSRRRPGTRRAPASGTSTTSRSTPGSNRTEVPAGMSRWRPHAAARSHSTPGLTAARWKCEPTCTGRSAALLTVIVMRSRPGLRGTAPSPGMTSPGPPAAAPAIRRSGCGRRRAWCPPERWLGPAPSRASPPRRRARRPCSALFVRST